MKSRLVLKRLAERDRRRAVVTVCPMAPIDDARVNARLRSDNRPYVPEPVNERGAGLMTCPPVADTRMTARPR
jgi:hypothetical protein